MTKTNYPIPEGFPEEKTEDWREFKVAQRIMEIVAAEQFTVRQGTKICMFVAARCIEQLKEPEAVENLSNAAVNHFVALTQRAYDILLQDPAVQVRVSVVGNKMLRRMAVRGALNTMVEFNMPDSIFMQAPVPTEPPDEPPLNEGMDELPKSDTIIIAKE